MKFIFRKFIRIPLIILISLLINCSLHANSTTEILLQGFNWESYSQRGLWFTIMGSKAEEIATAGFTSVWFPPVSYAYDGAGIYPHSRGYLPIEYFNLNSAYGTEKTLRATIEKYKQLGVNSIADLVLNHRRESGVENGAVYFNNPSWSLKEFTGGPGMIGQGAQDTGEAINYGFDLDFTSSKVQKDLISYLNWLKNDVGFSGWRYDFTKGYHGAYVGLLNEATNPTLSIGEYWTDMNFMCSEWLCYDQTQHKQYLTNWIDSTWKSRKERDPNTASQAFDFTTKGILQVAVRGQQFWRLRDPSGRAPGMIGWWPSKSVTFIDNHDTGSTQNHWPFGSVDEVMQGYAYILTHPGTPCIFWDHFFDWGLSHKIKILMGLRRMAGLTSTSSLNILRAEQGLYAAIVGNSVAIKLGSSQWSPGDGWSLVDSGHNYAVWRANK